MRLWLILTLWFAGLCSCLLAQSERILGYHSRIVVREDGSMVVTETITVQAQGKKIRRGIYRDFPTLYSGPFFTRVAVPFQVNRVARNGQREPFHTENLSAGVRLYIGREDRILDRGEHTYQIEYETARQLGFFQDYDELYWNVTGTEWAFPIETASAVVILPRGLPRSEIELEGYTGPQNSKEQNYQSRVDATTGEVHFSTTDSLGSGEGLTIVVSFPKGHVRQPAGEQNWGPVSGSQPGAHDRRDQPGRAAALLLSGLDTGGQGSPGGIHLPSGFLSHGTASCRRSLPEPDGI